MSGAISPVQIVHASAIAVAGSAALIRGPSGAGKSDLALRCLALAPSLLVPVAAELVADDQVRLARVGGRIVASAPDAIRGMIEVRGLGIVSLPAAREADVKLIVDLIVEGDIERLPDPDLSTTILDAAVPLMRLRPFEPSSAVKLLMRLAQFRGAGPGRDE